MALAWHGAALALGAAALFGASTLFAKLLLGSGASPLLLAGLLYPGSGVGLAVYFLVRRSMNEPRIEAPVVGADLPWLGRVILFWRERGGGAGVGLSIARWAVEAHGGEIGLQSEGTRGSTFCIRLPCVETSGRTKT